MLLSHVSSLTEMNMKLMQITMQSSEQANIQMLDSMSSSNSNPSEAEKGFLPPGNNAGEQNAEGTEGGSIERVEPTETVTTTADGQQSVVSSNHQQNSCEE